MSRSLRSLTFTSWLMAVLAVVFGLALLFDPRTIDGAPAWLKPAKFAVSLSIYGFTFAWMLRQLTSWPRMVALAAWLTTVAALVEVGLIALQAGRGVPSHFNTGTAFDAAVYGTMGFVIMVQTLSAGMIAVAMWWQSFPDRAMGWAMRVGLALTVLGGSIGGLMTRPSEMQSASLVTTGTMPRAGSHSVGGEDGGAGLPVLRWSTEHGDIRVAHFAGLHAMQVLPLVAFFTRRRMSGRSRTVVVLGAGFSYAALFILLLAQALAGQPLTEPSGWILVALGIWAAATAILLWHAWHGSRQRASSVSSPPDKST